MYAFEEHTAELAIRLEAPSLAELFAEAARALAVVMGGDAVLERPGESTERVKLGATDPEALLVGWIDELVYLSETKQRLFPHAAVERASGTEIVAIVEGVVVPHLVTQVKAATYHGLHVITGADGSVSARVIVDV